MASNRDVNPVDRLNPFCCIVNSPGLKAIRVGVLVGAPVVGAIEGMAVGVLVGRFVGLRVGARVGSLVGSSVGIGVGCLVGGTDGCDVGIWVGGRVGNWLGSCDGRVDGESVGTMEGDKDGSSVGGSLVSSPSQNLRHEGVVPGRRRDSLESEMDEEEDEELDLFVKATVTTTSPMTTPTRPMTDLFHFRRLFLIIKPRSSWECLARSSATTVGSSESSISMLRQRERERIDFVAQFCEILERKRQDVCGSTMRYPLPLRSSAWWSSRRVEEPFHRVKKQRWIRASGL